MKHQSRYQLAALVCLLVVICLGFLVTFHPGQLVWFDTTIQNFFVAHRPNWSPFFLTITKIGNPNVIVPIFLIVSIGLIYRKYYAESIWVAASFIGVSGLLNPLIKQLVHRARPDIPHLVIEKSFSFPSGHASASMAILGCFIFFSHRILKQKKARRVLQIALFTLILLIGCSRIYAGVHYPSDIVAGWSLSLAFLLATFPYYQKLCLKWLMQKRQV